MTDEVKAALGRLRRYYAGDSTVYRHRDSDARFTGDVLALLGGHPSDDGEPVTLPWLQSVGFERRMQPAAGSDLSLQVGDVRLFVAVARHARERYYFAPERWAVNEAWLPETATPTTRGHVRRLCASLGIPLTETRQ